MIFSTFVSKEQTPAASTHVCVEYSVHIIGPNHYKGTKAVPAQILKVEKSNPYLTYRWQINLRLVPCTKCTNCTVYSSVYFFRQIRTGVLSILSATTQKRVITPQDPNLGQAFLFFSLIDISHFNFALLETNPFLPGFQNGSDLSFKAVVDGTSWGGGGAMAKNGYSLKPLINVTSQGPGVKRHLPPD